MQRGWVGFLALVGVVAVMQAGVRAQTASPTPGVPTPFPVQSLGPALVSPIPGGPNPASIQSPLGGGGGGPVMFPNDPQSPGAGPVQGMDTSPVGRSSVAPLPRPSAS